MITIFTPTYNRANKINKLYNSLLEQTNNNFIWIIADDGSTDNTREKVELWIKEGKIKIKYLYQKNLGKSIAHNLGVLNCETSLFVCVDSDDYLDKDSIQILCEAYNSIENNKEIIGIAAYKKNVCNEEINTIKKHKEYVLVSDIYRKYKYHGDMLFAYKSNILKENLFPKIDNEKFMAESYLFDKLDNLGKLYFIDKVLYYYEYLDDGYTANSKKVLKNNPISFFIYAKNRLENSKNKLNVLYGAYHYCIACIILKRNIFKNTTKKLLVLFIYPLSLIDYLNKYKNI